MAPEEGRSAIQAAAKAIADLRLGRVDEMTTANVGVIRGGTAGNIVPDTCSFLAEARSHDERKLGELVQEMLDACAFAASETECELQSELRKSVPRLPLREERRAVVGLAAAALGRCGHEVRYGLSGGGADANVFNERGLRCVNLSHGVYDFHSPDERIAVADLEAMVDVTVALVGGGAGVSLEPDSARRVYEGRLLGLTVERWGENEREIVEHPGAVAIVAVDAEGYVALVRQLREATRKRLLELPAGTAEPGEEPLATAQRELQEECGLSGGEWRELAAFWTTPGFCRERMHLFAAEGVERGEAAPAAGRRARARPLAGRGDRRAAARDRGREDARRLVALPPAALVSPDGS